MEILNIDELVTPVEKKIVIGGKEYEVKEMTVQTFIDTSKAAKVIDDNPNATQAERVEQIIDMIVAVIPDCPKEVLYKVEFKQLDAILQYVRGAVAEEVKAGMKIAEKKEGEPKKARKSTR